MAQNQLKKYNKLYFKDLKHSLMEITSNIQLGQVVKSKMGRDVGKVFVVTKIIDDTYVEIVNGRLRTLSKPKKKKIKHLQVYKDVLKEVSTKETGIYEYNDSFIRKLLEPYEQIDLKAQEVSI